MTPIEFFRRLTAQPDNTTLSLPHVAAMVEMLSGLLTCKLDASVSQNDRAMHEGKFAKWIGESEDTVRSWRAVASTGTTTTPFRYRLASVVDWFLQHSLPLPESLDDASDEDKRRAIVAWWADAIPVLEVDGKLIGFFRSLPLEMEPAGYRLLFVHIDEEGNDTESDAGIRALEKQQLTTAMVTDVEETLSALDNFAKQVWHDGKTGTLVKARTTYNKIKNKAIPAVLLQFFRAVIWHDLEFAKAIAQGFDENLLRTHFRLAAWLFDYRVNHAFSEVGANSLDRAVSYLLDLGVDANQSVVVSDAQLAVVFQGTTAHVLADTTGEAFSLKPVDEVDRSRYTSVLRSTLAAGLDVDKPNNQRLTGRGIAQEIERRHGSSEFLGVVNIHENNKNLNEMLPTKPGKAKSGKPA